MLGQRDVNGVYQHIGLAANRTIVNEFKTLIQMGVEKDQAIAHLRKRHGEYAIQEGEMPSPPQPVIEPVPNVEVVSADIIHPDTDKTEPDPTTLLGWANFYSHRGLTDEEAMVMARSKVGAEPPPAPPTTAQPSDGETLTADKAMVDAYHERMKTYVEPKLDVLISVENPEGDDWTHLMPLRFIDYLVRSAQWETIKRRRDVNPADRLQMILREFRRDDQEVKLLMSPGATGPAGAFNPAKGAWE